MAKDCEYRFRIAGAYTPTTMPMERLAEYMVALAQLLGEETSVHLGAVENGSTVVVAKVDHQSEVKVLNRVSAVRRGDGSTDAQRAFHRLDDMLRQDNATGALSGNEHAIVIPFPGRDRPEPLVFGPFRQDGTLDGQVLRVGGKDDTVPVHLREGAVIHTGLYATPEVARSIAQHLLGPVVRVHGTGTWFRGGDGSWELRSFKVVDFEVLQDDPLDTVVAKLRNVKGGKWNEVPDAIRTLLDERHDEGDTH